MESISKFFARLGFPLRNTRWSWGAHGASGVLLNTWADDLDASGRFVRVLGWKAGSGGYTSTGLEERIDHLRTLWSGGLAGYAVIAVAKDVDARPRTRKSYDAETVRAIDTLVDQPDGSIWAELGDVVPVKALAKHAAHHRLTPGPGAFPIERARQISTSSAAYIARLPAMRAWLIELARRRGTATYAEARAPFGLRPFEHRHAMDRIGHECLDAGEPVLTSLIVDAATGRCSSGFYKEFRRDDADEREDCYSFWAGAKAPGGGAAVSGTGGGPEEDLRDRAARFARVAVRPDQAAFRRRVFMAYGGACAVTGCTIGPALDAAHRNGRDWRLGHNRASDGVLLRKDIHALYDAGLVEIDSDGRATFKAAAVSHYAAYAGKS